MAAAGTHLRMYPYVQRRRNRLASARMARAVAPWIACAATDLPPAAAGHEQTDAAQDGRAS
jgi:hypothetical protein